VPDELDLTLTGLAYGGDSLGRDDDGRMIFVPFALPGERVRVRVRDAHKRWARAELLQVLEPSPERIQPRCRHFAECGGCHYQHLGYPAQLLAKRSIVVEQLQRIGGFQDPPVLDVIPSPNPWNYRNQMQFHVAASGKLGLIRQGGGPVLELLECHLPQPAISALWPLVEVQERLDIERVNVRSDSHGGTMIIFHAGEDASQEVEILGGSSVIWSTPSAWRVLGGEPQLEMEVLERTFRVSPDAFFQVNSSLVPTLVEQVLAAARVQPGQLALDLFAGVGLFSLFLAERGARVVAVESSPAAAADFELNLDPYPAIELYESPVDAALPAITDRPDVVVADPPRAGLGHEVVDLLLERRPGRLVYVSCDPATMARDSQRLAEGGMRLEQVQPIDLFPQTYHIESISSWSGDDAR